MGMRLARCNAPPRTNSSAGEEKAVEEIFLLSHRERPAAARNYISQNAAKAAGAHPSLGLSLLGRRSSRRGRLSGGYGGRDAPRLLLLLPGRGWVRAATRGGGGGGERGRPGLAMDEQAGPGVFFSNNNNNNALLLPPPAGGPGLEPGEAAAAAAAAAAAGGGGGVSASGVAAPVSASRAQYSVPGILHFLQHEWGRFEAERAEWEAERAELQVTPHDLLPPPPRLWPSLPRLLPNPMREELSGFAADHFPSVQRAAADRRRAEGRDMAAPRGAAPARHPALAASPEFSGCLSRAGRLSWSPVSRPSIKCCLRRAVLAAAAAAPPRPAASPRPSVLARSPSGPPGQACGTGCSSVGVTGHVV